MNEVINEKAQSIVDEIDSEVQNEEKEENRFKVMTIDAILATNYGEQEWLVERLIPLETISVISGHPGSFKTWFTMQLAKSMSTGALFLDKFATEQGAVLFIDEENTNRLVKKRFHKLGLQNNSNLPIFYLSQIGFRIDREKDLERLLSVIKENNIKLVIFDSLIRIHRGDENVSKDMAKVLSGFQKIVAEGVNVIFTHHHRKEQKGSSGTGQKLRGSSDILAGVDAHLAIQHDEQESCLYIEQPKLRQDESLKPFSVKIIKNDEIISFHYNGEDNRQKQKLEKAREMVTNVLKNETDKLDINQIREKLEDKASKHTVRDVLEELTEDGLVSCKKGRHNKHFYSWNSNI